MVRRYGNIGLLGYWNVVTSVVLLLFNVLTSYMPAIKSVMFVGNKEGEHMSLDVALCAPTVRHARPAAKRRL